MNSGYVFNSAEEAKARFAGESDGYLYSRYGNPTVTMFEERMALNEGSETCFATATGMSAVFASLMCQLKSGDHVLSSRALFGSSFDIIDQIFFPMVTRKGNGHGLGLPLTQAIVDQHRGFIDCASSPGSTTFHIYLPLEQPVHD